MDLNLIDLPYEQLLPIYKLCYVPDLINLACTSRSFYDLVIEHLWHVIEIPWGILASELFRTKNLDNMKYTCVLRLRTHSSNIDWDSLGVNYRYLLEHCNSEKLTTLEVKGVLCDEGIMMTCESLYNLKNISLEDCENISMAGWLCLSGLHELKSIFINYCPIDKNAVEHIIKVQNLQVLEFGGLCIKTSKPLCIPTKLKKLTICEADVTFEYNYLANNLHLKELLLNGAHINNETMSCISSLTNLKKLGIVGSSGVTDVDLSCLSKLISLEELELIYNVFTVSGLFHLSKLVSLKQLDLSGCDNSEIELSYIYSLTSLTHLTLQGYVCVMDYALTNISNLENLKLLDISTCDRVTDLGIYYISKLTSLQQLYLNDCNQITDVALRYISNLTLLNHLYLHSCCYITDTGLGHLSKLKCLKELGIRGIYCITDKGLSYLQSLSLHSLNIEKCEKLSDLGLSYISTMPSLFELNINSCVRISDIGLLHISKLTSLRKLKISWTTITDVGLSYLYGGLRLLRDINIAYCKNVTNSGVSQLCNLPYLKNVWLCDCPNVNIDELIDYPLIYLHNYYSALS